MEHLKARRAAADSAASDPSRVDKVGDLIGAEATSKDTLDQAGDARVPPPFDWRAYLAVHPAAEFFPLMKEKDPEGFNALVENIRVHGLIEKIVGWSSNEGVSVLDGRNRLDALAQLGLLCEMPDHLLGIKKWTGEKWVDQGIARIAGYDGAFRNLYDHDGDPYEIVLSLNAHRRHLTAAGKNDFIAAVLKAKPELSNRQIGVMTQSDKNKVGAVRTKLEATGEISPVEKRTGKDNKAHPAKIKKKSTVPSVPKTEKRKAENADLGQTAEEKATKASAHYLAEFTAACRSVFALHSRRG